MKKVKFFINCMTSIIKKKIFKSSKTDICQECQKVLDKVEEAASIEELKLTEDYALKYNTTTRWQTL